MTRKKVKLAYITNDSARKATFKKRKKGFLKKMYELTTLCEIEACAVIYSPYDAQPEAWPNALGAQRVLSKFRRMPEMEKSKKMVNHEGFLRQRINKGAEQLKKQQKENREKEVTKLMTDCLGGLGGTQNLSYVDLTDLGWLIDQNLKEIYKRIDVFKKQAANPRASKRPAMAEAMQQQQPALPPPPPPPPALPPLPAPPVQMEQVMVQGGDRFMQQSQMAQQVFDNNNVDFQDPMPMRGSWLMDLMGPQDPMVGCFAGGASTSGGAGAGGVAGDNIPMNFSDYNNQNLSSMWSSAFFP